MAEGGGMGTGGTSSHSALTGSLGDLPGVSDPSFYDLRHALPPEASNPALAHQRE